MTGYDAIVHRQTLRADWDQSALRALRVVVLAGGPVPAARAFVRDLAALGVGDLRIIAPDEAWTAETVAAAQAINPHLSLEGFPTPPGDAAPWFEGLTVAFDAPRGPAPRQLGGPPPRRPVPLEATGTAAPWAVAEAVTEVVARCGAFPRLRLTTPATLSTTDVPDKPFAFFLVGCGALGNCLLDALHLAGLAPSVLWLVDPDRVDASNLNRQVLFTDADRGALKAERLADRARALFPGCAVEHRATAFDPVQLDGFRRAAGPRPTLAALLTDGWSSRLAVTRAAVPLGVDLLYAGTTFDTARVRVLGPGVEGSWCLVCGGEAAPDADDVARPGTGSCSRAPDASMLLPNLFAAAEATHQISTWLRDGAVPRGGAQIVLTTERRRQEGPIMAACGCLTPPLRVGRVEGLGDPTPVYLGASRPVANEAQVVGVRRTDGRFGALLLLAPDASAATAVGGDALAGVHALGTGERCLVAHRPYTFVAERVAARADTLGATACAFCLRDLSADETAVGCPSGHALCARCADGGCPYCDEGPAESTTEGGAR